MNAIIIYDIMEKTTFKGVLNNDYWKQNQTYQEFTMSHAKGDFEKTTDMSVTQYKIHVKILRRIINDTII